MAKQLNVALDFTANTTQAKQQIQELQQLLTKVAYSTDLGIDPSQMKEASAAAKELAVHLNEAYNQKTGNYDLSKLNASLAKSKTNVTELSTSLLQAGTTGQQAFIKLAQSIAAADQPMITLNARLQDFLTTVKNTVKWQISSSMIHGVMGALQGAYHYAQNLNSSLNDIRIVTGHNIDYMDKFADRANKAAKALSTSTLNYTDASLIYYQQGLSDKEVEDRTAVTIKMANAAGESADKISQQLTAVWNNFYDGSQSLEYYADVMTALGAATASSTDEIAAGLEKFAAVSNTVGLSYEYATSALATVTATTRQSADVVGTAFKTLFARIQDLELGKTLEDGTTLGKYSQALDAVGVSIKTADGGLREMDDILDDLGEKWNSFDTEGNPLISKDAKVALAQTVAGVRQYTQLIALMDKWDFMKENLETARNATGTLTEQQKIYEESWKAANKRLQASFQALYTDLIDDKFFIKFTDFLSDMVDGADSFIDKIGGLKTLLIGILGIVGQTLSSKITPMLDSLINNIKILTGGSSKVYGKIRDEMNTKISSVIDEQKLNVYQEQQLKGATELNIAKQKLAKVTQTLTDSERQLAEVSINGFEMQQREVEKLAQKATTLKENLEGIKSTIKDGAVDLSNKKFSDIQKTKLNIESQLDDRIDENRLNRDAPGISKDIQTRINNKNKIYNRAYDSLIQMADAAEESVGSSVQTIMQHFIQLGEKVEGVSNEITGAEVFSGVVSNLEKLKISLNGLHENSPTLSASLDVIRGKIDILNEALPESLTGSQAFKKAMQEIQEASEKSQMIKGFNSLLKVIKETTLSLEDQERVLKEFGATKKDIDLVKNGYKSLDEVLQDIETRNKNIRDGINNFNPKHLAKLPETFVNLASSIGNAVMSINSFKSAFDSLKDPDLSGWEKASSFIISLSFALPMLYNAIKTLTTGFTQLMQILGYTSLASNVFTDATNLMTMASIKHNVVLELQKHTQKELNNEEKQSVLIKTLVSLGLTEQTAATIATTFATQGLNAALKVLNTELTKIILKFLAFLGPIAAIVAAVAALGAAIYLSVKQSQSAQNEIKQANEDLSFLRENLEQVNSEVQKSNTLIDTLNSKKKALSELTFGTVEWRQSVYDLNKEVQSLIDKYNLIEGKDWYWSDLGTLELTEEGIKSYKEQALEQQQKAATAVSSQQKRTDELNVNTRKKNLIENTESKEIGTRIVPNFTTTWQATSQGMKQVQVQNGTKEVPDIVSLTQKDVDAILKASKENRDFDPTNQEDLKTLAGLSDKTIELIMSEDKTVQALRDLTIETKRLNENYETSVLNELYARGLDLSGYDAEYRAGIGDAIAADVVEYEKSLIESVTGDNKLSEDQVYSLLSEQGINISSIDNDVISDFINNNKTKDFTTIDENGDEKTVKLDYDTLIANWAAEQSRAWGLTQQDNYYQMQEETKSAYQGIDAINQSIGTKQEDGNYKSDTSVFEDYDQAIDNKDSYGSEGFRTADEIRENEEAISNLQAEIEAIQPALADMFGIIDENNDVFNDILDDGEFLADNAATLQKALDGDSEAVNELRERYNEYAEEVKKANIKKWMDSDGVKDYFEAIKNGGQASTGELESLRSVMSNNSEEVASFMGVSNRAFKAFLSKNGAQGAAAAAKALQKAVKGDTSELIGLRTQMGKDYVATLDIEDEQVKTKINSLTEELAALSDSNEFQVKIAADPEAYAQFVNTCNQIIADAGMTAEQAQEYFKSIGFDAVIKEKDIKGKEVEHHKEYAKFDGYEGGEPQFVKERIDMTDKLPDTKGFAVESITPSGNAGGNITQEAETVDSSNGDGENGGGGGGDSYTPPPPKEYKDEIERYHVIKQKIEDLEEVMEHLAKAKERAFGTSKLELMEQEIEKYDEMIDLQNQYLDEINKYWDEDKALIASYGAEFDETGVITNYDEIMKRQIDKYNSSIGKNEEADDAAEEAYDDFIEALEQYEETNNLRQDELEKLYDLQTELADVIFEKTQYKIEIKIAVKDDELEYLDYLLSKIEDDAYSAAEAIALIGEKTQNTLEKTKTYSDGLMELLNNHGINSIEELDKLTVDDLKAKNFTEKEIDQIREWRSSILEANQELLEMRATIQEKVLDSFNQFSEDVQDQIDLFEHYQNILEGVKDITSLLGAQLNEQSKLVLRNLNRSLMNNSINNLAGVKQQVETLKQMRTNAQEQYDKAVANGDSIGIKQWNDSLKEIDEQVHSAEENFLDTWQEALERAHDIFEEEMDNIVKEFEDGISPIYGSIEALQDAITRANELNDQYLSDADKTYELNKLRRQIEGSIDNTDIIPHKQALNKLQDELNKKLKDGSKISEYDLKILQSKYELELARQKLEDVQNSNETVRLTRDNNGNWGYVYSADEDKIAEAEQEYEDKLNAYQKANEEYLKTLENNILQLQSDYQEKLTAIKLSFTQGEISQAEYEKQAADLEKYYDERMQQIHQQYEEVFKNSKDANEKFVTYYKDSSGALVENFNQTTLALKTGYSTLDEMFNAFWKSHDNYVADSNKLLDDYLNKIKEINSTAGIEGSFADAASGWSIKITGESDKAVADMGKIVKNATDSFNDVIKAAGEWEFIYISKIDSAIKRNEALVKTMNEMVAALSGINSIDYSKYENAIDSRSTATANNIISTQRNSESFNKTVEVPDYISQFSYLDMLDQLDMNKQIEDWMSNNELNIDTALMDSLDISTILQNIGLNVQTIVSYLSNLIPSSLGVDRIAQEFMQQVSINADFPNVTDSNEIMEAFEMMENEASQYASRKTI